MRCSLVGAVAAVLAVGLALGGCRSAERKHACELAKVEAIKAETLMDWCVEPNVAGRIDKPPCIEVGNQLALARETRNALCFGPE